MKKILFAIFAILVAAFVVIQFFRIDTTNPPVNAADTIAASMEMPPAVDATIKRSCYDCHSNETKYPWYTNVQPVAWWMKNHIDEGRRELNFSQFSTYQPRKKKHKLEEICEQVSKGEMPLPSYLWGHSDAALTADDKKLLCDWANAEAAKIEVPAA